MMKPMQLLAEASPGGRPPHQSFWFSAEWPNVDHEHGLCQRPANQAIFHQHSWMEVVGAHVHPQISQPPRGPIRARVLRRVKGCFRFLHPHGGGVPISKEFPGRTPDRHGFWDYFDFVFKVHLENCRSVTVFPNKITSTSSQGRSLNSADWEVFSGLTGTYDHK